MASSNRHWPSMFKSKPPCNHHQWQHEINSSLMSSSPVCHRTPYTSVPGCEDRSPEPKPRWNPKPEQIRILEAIFNSGMVNPPRDEIRKIRTQLQEYGQVGDANVFYWFQNRKSRSKHKLRHLQNSKQQQSQQTQPPPATTVPVTPPPYENNSPKGTDNNNNRTVTTTPPNMILDSAGSPPVSVNQTFFANDFLVTEPFFFPVGTGGGEGTGFGSQGFGFSELANVVHVPDHHQSTVGPCTSLLLSEMIASRKDRDHEKMQLQLSCTVSDPPLPQSIPPFSASTTTVTISKNLQGIGEGSSIAARSTVFINDVPFEIAAAPLNVREAFGDDAVLLNSAGQPVLTNEWGVTVQVLQHGACYYLVRPLCTSSFSA